MMQLDVHTKFLGKKIKYFDTISSTQEYVRNEKVEEGEIKKLDLLTTVIAESLVQAVRELYLITLQIKKPNDVMYKNKKMGGILTESIIEGNIAKKIFIGIGFNVNQEEFPGNLGDIATSLKKEFQADFSREDILSRFLEIFEDAYLDLIR